MSLFSGVGGERNVDFNKIQQDSNAETWAVVNERQLVRLGKDDIWHPEDTPLSSNGRLTTLFLDSRGTHWLVADGYLYRKARGERRFRSTAIRAFGEAQIKEDVDHSIWLVGQTSKLERQGTDLQHVSPDGQVLHFPFVFHDIHDFLTMPDGSLWLLEGSTGLYRLRKSKTGQADLSRSGLTSELYTASHLTSDFLMTLYADMEGDVWVGSWKGLDRFKRAIILPAVDHARTGYWPLCTNNKGETWIAHASTFAPLSVLRDGKVINISGTSYIYKMFCSQANAVWFADASGLGYSQDDHIHHLPLPPFHPGYFAQWFFSGLTDINGELIASERGSVAGGLWRYRNGTWARYLPDVVSWPIQAMIKDADGRLYMGRIDGTISILQNENLKTISSGSPGLGVIAAFSQTSCGLFALGANGIAVNRGEQFQALAFAHPEQAKTVTGLVEEKHGGFWLNGSEGIIRISAHEMRAALQDSRHCIQSQVIREGDFSGPAYFGMSSAQSAQLDRSGRIWFSTTNGVVSIDPDQVDTDSHLPRLSIRSISADGQSLNQGRVFQPHPQTLNITYIGVTLSNPERVVYRYRLDGLDHDWQDVGSRREAIYTRLKPGVYTFRVMASNGTSRWTNPISSSSFRVLPSFYQTWWFGVLCVVAAVASVWFLLQIRVQYEVNAVRLRAEERADERIRIARELHDTLLQGVQGLMLSIHVAAHQLSTDDQSKKILDKALTIADQILIEGRNRVNQLRSERLTDSELLESLERLGNDLQGGEQIRYSVHRSGTAAILRPHIVGEILYIAREALANSFRHSGASEIRIELQYRVRSFRILCLDNGCGFDVAKQQEDPAVGHWGLRGISERAEKVGGRLSIVSAIGRGTEVLFTMPSYRAYLRTGMLRAILNGLRFGVAG